MRTTDVRKAAAGCMPEENSHLMGGWGGSRLCRLRPTTMPASARSLNRLSTRTSSASPATRLRWRCAFLALMLLL